MAVVYLKGGHMADEKSYLRLVASNDDLQANTDLKQLLQASIDLEGVQDVICDAPCEGEDLVAVLSLALAAEPVEEDEEEINNVIDFQVARAECSAVNTADVTPETVLKLALQDVQAGGQYKDTVKKCYITLVLDTGETFSTCNYRANLTRIEEVAFRQLGVSESLEGWRGVVMERE
jgi:hypothetical protein